MQKVHSDMLGLLDSAKRALAKPEDAALRKHIADRFTWDKIAACTVAAYTECSDAKKGARR